MIYLDYSATTPVNDEVMDSFVKVSKDYIGNANSLHLLGVNSKKLMDQAVLQVASILNVESNEVIFTSCASESNNLAIMGVIDKYKYRGKHIITTKLEHSSVLETLLYAESLGYKIDYLPLLENGVIDLEYLKKILTKDTILVSIASVSSELGILQPIDEIGSILKEYPTVIFHVDATQSVGKVDISLDNIDLFSFSAHKFYGIKGSGCLIKKANIELTPIIHGGKSQTIYRSGTPALGLIVSLAKALRIASQNISNNYKYIKELQSTLLKQLSVIEDVVINSTDVSIPHIVNISIPNIKAETFLHALEQYEIYVSTKTACSKNSDESISLLAMGKNKSIASSSIRVSISHLTTVDDIIKFSEVFKECYQKLKLK